MKIAVKLNKNEIYELLLEKPCIREIIRTVLFEILEEIEKSELKLLENFKEESTDYIDGIQYGIQEIREIIEKLL